MDETYLSIVLNDVLLLKPSCNARCVCRHHSGNVSSKQC